ncbi:leukotoxin (plasmid) [Antarctobacter heliothermus]|uniref:Leukotoxin n=1 Tax=Antarctobacter heliothermus TaxID=74033 RepID=A0A222EBX8_9RHOB|nr:calcium-binding protein [Antarctobacter heliothermus]ASP23610.1 leukotoxin [Antarctobacter heliothermus]
MASFNINALVTAQQTLNNGEAGIIGPQGSLQVFAFPVIMNGGASLLVDGSILGFGNGVDAQNATAVTMYVGPNGSIQTNGHGLIANVTDSTQIINHGSIIGSLSALELTTDAAAVLPINHDVINTGLLSSISEAAVILEITNTGFIEFTNSGVISSSSRGIDNSLTGASGGLSIFRNTGEILAGQDIGGTPDHAFLGGASTDYLINSGVISGEIDMGAGADFYNANGGTTSGRVLGGLGNDTLQGGSETDQMLGGDDADLLIGRGGDDILSGEAGNDYILGGAGNDSMTGGNNFDTINGNAGDDTLYGEAGNDVLVGQDGSDFLDGGMLDDTLDGGNGDDILEGGSGNDILRGRAGEDDLAGGTGRDLLTGGEGADNFVFRGIAEAGIGATRDQILDFEQGVDLIVVAGLSPGVFEFRGTAGFAPSGNPELRLFETPTGSTIVQIDNNGDGTIDAEIRVGGVTGLTADDFVL